MLTTDTDTVMVTPTGIKLRATPHTPMRKGLIIDVMYKSFGFVTNPKAVKWDLYVLVTKAITPRKIC